MKIFFIKSLLSLGIILFALIGMYTMFEVLGGSERRFTPSKLTTFHRISGILYIVLFIFIAYFCLDFIIQTKAELSPRATFHATFALSVAVLLFTKIALVRFYYRQHFGTIKNLGLMIALLTFGMVGTSAGYYLLVSGFGTDRATEERPVRKAKSLQTPGGIAVRTDPESVQRGKELYNSKCYSCHDPLSTDTVIGPGHKGILKNPLLPVSKRAATPDNIALQIRDPFSLMPDFAYLSDDEIGDIIAYLKTL